ncbi:MAG: hypothetical protein U9N30_09325 [Campylobacterota bacterium]|nr:hypothetical protein [Campylobacterota bacterium]
MISDVINNNEYKQMVAEQIKEVLDHLLVLEEEFALTANIKGVGFDPELPSPITSVLAPFSLFVLSNYSYQSIVMHEDHIQFEAGFGKENFGSVVTIPFNAIFQIIVEESILFVNPTATIDSLFPDVNQKEKSRNAFKLNQKNKDLV